MSKFYFLFLILTICSNLSASDAVQFKYFIDVSSVPRTKYDTILRLFKSLEPSKYIVEKTEESWFTICYSVPQTHFKPIRMGAYTFQAELEKKTRRYLIVKPFCGMGNRLRAVASAKILAEVTQREIFIVWEKNNLGELVGNWDDFFDSPLSIARENQIIDGYSIQEIMINNDNKNIKNIRMLETGSQLELSEIAKLSHPIIYLESSVPFSFPRESLQIYVEKIRQFYKKLQPSKAIQQKIEAFKAETKFQDYFMIGVHYRGWQTGPADNQQNLITDPENRYITAFIEHMTLAMKEAEKTGQKVAFFLAADNQKAKQEIPIHPAFMGLVFYRPEKVDRFTKEGQENAMVDFFLLGDTQYIIGTNNSSFSDEAKYRTVQCKKIDIGDQAYKY